MRQIFRVVVPFHWFRSLCLGSERQGDIITLSSFFKGSSGSSVRESHARQRATSKVVASSFVTTSTEYYERRYSTTVMSVSEYLF